MDDIRCPRCRKRIMSEKQGGGFVITSRMITLNGKAEAKCPQCRSMVEIPIVITPVFDFRPLPL